MRTVVSEQDLAAVVVAYLDALGADVYQEVEVPGGIADIVAKLRAEAWIVEVKASLSLALLVQAAGRRRIASRVIMACPHTRNSRDVGALCDDIGLGLWEVTLGVAGMSVCGSGFGDPHVREVVAARRWNRRPTELLALLRPEHKTHAKAGAVGAGGRWTPFRATCEELARVVRAEPGITVKAAVEKMRHHYRSSRSAVSSLAHWVERGKVAGVRLDRSDRALRLQPTEAR